MRAFVLRGLRRLLVFSLGGSILALSGWTIAGLLEVVPRSALVFAPLRINLDPWASGDVFLLSWVSAAGLVAGFVVALLALLPDHPPGQAHHTLSASRTGDIHLSERAVRALLAFEAERHEGVRQASPRVTLARKGWRVHVDVDLWQGQPFHTIGDALRSNLTQALELQTGLPVSKLTVDLSSGPDGHRVR